MGTSAKLTRFFYGTHWLFVEKALNFHVFQYFLYIFANRIFFIQIYIETFVGEIKNQKMFISWFGPGIISMFIFFSKNSIIGYMYILAFKNQFLMK